MPLDPSVRRFLDILAAGDSAGVLPVPARRENFRNLLRMAGGGREIAVHSEDLIVTHDGHGVPVRFYRPAGTAQKARPALVFIHGGGFIAGDLDTHDGVCRTLCDASRLTVVAVDYRLAPEHPFPAAIDDVSAVLRALVATSAKFGIDASRLAIGGDSVGANLASVVCHAIHDEISLSAQLLICPVLDLAGDYPSRQMFARGFYLDADLLADDLRHYLPARVGLADPRLSPARKENLAGLPRALIHVAECDPFRDEAVAYAQRLRDAAVTTDLTQHAGMIHLFYGLSRMIPRGGVALRQIGEQLGRQMIVENVQEPAAMRA